VKARFSKRFKDDLLREETKYAKMSQRLASAFRERVAGQTREIIKWKGGDHAGPHGFRYRRTKPFPFYIYYAVEGDPIYFLGLVHERRHPDYLKKRIEGTTRPERCD
jgi:hypothetical protein